MSGDFAPPLSLLGQASSIALQATGILAGTSTLLDWLGDLDTHTDTTARPTMKRYGAKADAVKLTDGAITSGAAVLTSASATFTNKDVGKVVAIQGAGPSNGLTAFGSIQLANNAFKSTIQSVTDAHTVVLAANAATTVSGAIVVYGTDDTAAIQKALDSARRSDGRVAGCVVDLGSYAYLVSDMLSLSIGNQELRGGTLLVVDTDATTYNGSANTFNYAQACTIGLNQRFGYAYTGPAYPAGKTFAALNYTGTDADWLSGFSVHDMVIDLTAVTYGYPGGAGGATSRFAGDSVIGGLYIGRANVYRNTIISAQAGGISLRGCYASTIAENRVLGMRCTLDSNGNVNGGNAIQFFSAYPGVTDGYTQDVGANKVIGNTVVGTDVGKPFPGSFVASSQNALISGNIGIDVQTGGYPQVMPLRTSSTAYNVNDRVTSVNAGYGYAYVCTVAGTTGSSNASAPVATSGNADLVDGTVTWRLALSGPQWVPNCPGQAKTYAAGARVNNNGITYYCTTGGTPATAAQDGSAVPSGPTGTGTGITDGTCVWSSVPGGPLWTVSTPYNAGQKLYNGRTALQCVQAGTSASAGNGPVGRDVGTLVVDGTAIWQIVTSYMRPMPQEHVALNTVRRFYFGIMAEGQRIGGGGAVLITANDVDETLIGIDNYSDMSSGNSTMPWSGHYGTTITGNRVTRAFITGIRSQSSGVQIHDNLVLDWGTTSLNLKALGAGSSLPATSYAIRVMPQTGETYGTDPYATSVQGNLCLLQSNFDPYTNYFVHGGIVAQTQFANQVWKNVTIKSNVVDFGQSIRVRSANLSSWAASTAYGTIGQYIVNGAYQYRLKTAGTSASSGGPTGYGTADITDGTCVWQFAQVTAAFGNTSSVGVLVQGWVQDIEVSGNDIYRSPSAGICAGPNAPGAASFSMGPCRLTISRNRIIEPGYNYNTSSFGSRGILVQTNGQSGYTIEGNFIYDPGSRLLKAIEFPQEVTGADNTVGDVTIRGNKVKTPSLGDQKVFNLAFTGSNIRVESNEPYNYASALPTLSSVSGNVFAGTMVWNAAVSGGSAPAAWIATATGKIASAWAASTAYALNAYVTNGLYGVYVCTVAGTSAASGGPTVGSGTTTDGTVTWKYVGKTPTFAPMAVPDPAPATGLTAAGSTQGTATALGYGLNSFATVALMTGGVLPATPQVGQAIYVQNLGANALSVYPASGAAINALSANAAASVAVGATALFKAVSSTLWAGIF